MPKGSIDAKNAVVVLDAVLQNSENLFAAIDTDYRFIAFNHLFFTEFKKVYNVDIKMGDRLLQYLEHLPQERQHLLELWGRGLAGDQFTTIQNFGEHDHKVYEIRYYPIRDEFNKVVGTFQLARNVTKQNEMQTQIVPGEEGLRGLFDTIPIEVRLFAEAMPQMAFIGDKLGNITYFNQRHYDYFGMKQGESEDWKWAETNMLYPEDLPRTIARWSHSILSGEPYEMEYRLRRYDGVFRWHLARALPVRNSEGEIVRWIGTNTDIDEQKKVAQQLDQLLKEVKFEKSRFEAVMKQMPAAVIIGEAPTGKLVFANEKMAEVWGHELLPSQSITDYIDWIGFHADGRLYAPEEWPLARSIMNGEVVSNEDVEIRKAGGARAILRLSSTPILGEKGEIVAGVVICQDVTELKDAIRGRDEFLSMCSHELKTPLTSLKLASQKVLRNIRKGDPLALSPERMTHLLNQTEIQLNRLSQLVEDMLDISRISSGKLSLNLKEFDLCELTREVTERMSCLFEDVGTKLKIDSCASAICVGDTFRIEQVITNLLTNAVRYGEGKPITVSTRIQEGYAVTSVTDQGRGIAEENFERIFNRYERLVTANEVSGLGLGLFITKQIVELHHGKIWVESILGAGSTFSFGIPLKEGPQSFQ